jgi:pimeloyl-ACP methyl ester carboxylesterase
MTLHHRIQGEGAPLVILHGLFGSSDNWRNAALQLSQDRQVITVDLPNHGQSPHVDEVSYLAMADDVAQLIGELDLGSPDIIGHSIGGKVAMTLAANHPEQINRLIVVDMGPKHYPDRHSHIFDALLAIDLSTVTKRNEADNVLAKTISNKAIRQFLLMNLVRDNGALKWQLNLPVLAQQYPRLIEAVCEGVIIKQPCLFMRGALSDYIEEEDIPLIKQKFPHIEFITIEQAGHWVHAEKPKEFITSIKRFLTHD